MDRVRVVVRGAAAAAAAQQGGGGGEEFQFAGLARLRCNCTASFSARSAANSLPPNSPAPRARGEVVEVAVSFLIKRSLANKPQFYFAFQKSLLPLAIVFGFGEER